MRSRSRFIGRRREGSRESSTQAGHGRAAGRLTGASAEAFTGGRLDMETAPGGAVSADTPEGLRSAAAGPGPGAGSAAAAAASAATPAAGTGARPRARGAGPCGWMSCPECHLEPPVSSTRLGCPGQLGPRGVRRRRGGGKSFSMAGAGLGKDVWKRADQGKRPRRERGRFPGAVSARCCSAGGGDGDASCGAYRCWCCLPRSRELRGRWP